MHPPDRNGHVHEQRHRPHDIEADVGCTPLNLGAIAPGANKVATFPWAATCAYHDALNATNALFQGTVAVSPAPVTGPGY